MVEKIIIRDNTKCPVSYISELKAFKNGTTFDFKPGVNIIVGENGCGKTTLLKLLGRYLMLDERECEKGMFNSNINALYGFDRKLLDGADVYADYRKNTFRLVHMSEKSNDSVLKDFDSFGTYYEQAHSSTGEGVNIALNSLFRYIFSKKVKKEFDYSQFAENWPEYESYIRDHRLTDIADEWTLILDEPDRNLDILNVDQVKNILSFHKEQTQVIAVVHNPLLIYSLSKNKEVNVIEMTPGYAENVRKAVDRLLK